MNIESTFWLGILLGAMVYTITNNHELGLMCCGLFYIGRVIGLVICCALDNIRD